MIGLGCKMSIIVPIGVDCGVANFLRDNGYRNFSLPFDWVVSYGGVTNIIKKEFDNFEKDKSVNFIHHSFPDDNKKINRRIKRFLDLLNGDDEIIFLRKAHSEHHHNESNLIKNDFEDCEDLYDLLKLKYKKLKFKIILFLVCSECFYEKKFASNKIVVYNVSDKDSRSLLIEKFFPELEKETGIQKNLAYSFIGYNL